MDRKWDIKDESIKRQCINEIIGIVEGIDTEQVGIIAAQDILDTVTKYVGPQMYNLGVSDTKKVLQDRFNDIEIDIDLLEQKI